MRAVRYSREFPFKVELSKNASTLERREAQLHHREISNRIVASLKGCGLSVKEQAARFPTTGTTENPDSIARNFYNYQTHPDTMNRDQARAICEKTGCTIEYLRLETELPEAHVYALPWESLLEIWEKLTPSNKQAVYEHAEALFDQQELASIIERQLNERPED